MGLIWIPSALPTRRSPGLLRYGGAVTSKKTDGSGTAIEEICRVKYAYLRLLDLKEFSALGELLTNGCTAAYDDGKLSFEGRDAIVGFLEESLSDPGFVTKHQVHHPEITIEDGDGDDEGRATALWYLEDRVIIPAADLEIAGTAIYEDRFEKVGGAWKIAHTGYRRIYEEHRAHSTLELRTFTSRF